MINVRELKLGNKVKTKKGDILTVSTLQIVQKGKQNMFNEEYTIIDFYENKVGFLITSSMDDKIDPIPLTVNIIEKCGFIKNQSGYYKPPFFIYLPGGPQFNFGFGIKGVGLVQSIQYLHQLQNIVSTLSVEELEINLL